MSGSQLAESPQSGGWGDAEKAEWLARQIARRPDTGRSYSEDVLAHLNALPSETFTVEQYGALRIDPDRYPLYRVRTGSRDASAPTVVITGGVHGYEPSGIMGALRFLKERAPKYAEDKINFLVYPCVSPFAYEIDHRWNWRAEDPNRNFRPNGNSEEALKVMESVEAMGTRFRAAADLHETNYRDIELRNERDSRDGKPPSPENERIPEGFYLCMAKGKDVALGQKIVKAAERVTPICADEQILGYPNIGGVIVLHDVGDLCQGFMRERADFAMTTEMYPDKTPPKVAQNAQLAAVSRTIKAVLAPNFG